MIQIRLLKVWRYEGLAGGSMFEVGLLDVGLLGGDKPREVDSTRV